MKRTSLVTQTAGITLAVIATACGPEPVDAITIDGSAGVAPLVGALAEAYRVRFPTANVALATGLGSSARLKAVQDGQIQIAMASHGVDSADLAQRGLTARTIARTAVVFAVNADVPVPQLTSQQICDLYGGRISRWRDVGGPALDVTPLFRPPEEVDAAVALDGIECLGTTKFGDRVRVIDRPDAMATAIGDSSGALGVTSAPMVARQAGRMRALVLNGVAPSPENVATGVYPLARDAILVHRRKPARGVEQFLAFVGSAEGDRVIRANGAVPVAPRP